MCGPCIAAIAGSVNKEITNILLIIFKDSTGQKLSIVILNSEQRQWHPERDKDKRAEVGHCNKLQVPCSSVSDVAPNQKFSQGLHKPLQLLQS